MIAEVQRLAPGGTIEWLAPSTATIVHVESRTVTPEGVRRADAGELTALTFARKGHPAIAHWGAAAWTRWPHIVVELGERVRSQMEIAAHHASWRALDVRN